MADIPSSVFAGAPAETEVRSQWQLVLRRFLAHRLAVAAGVVLVVAYLFSYLAEPLTGWGYKDLSPDLSQGPSGDHWFGTDTIGHDMFAQSMRGLRVSVHVSLVVAAIATVLGSVLGAVQGWFRGRVDGALGLLVDFLLILPLLPVLMVLGTRTRASGGSSLMFVAVVIGLFLWAPLARVVRGEVFSIREKEYIEAAEALGASNSRIIFRHLIPNAMSSIIVYATLTVATAILLETALAFLGFGIQPPEVSLGSLVDEGRDAARTRWWLFYLPGAVLVLLVLCVNFVGDGLRDALDPRREQRR